MIVNIVKMPYFGIKQFIAIAKKLFTLIMNHNIILVPKKKKR